MIKADGGNTALAGGKAYISGCKHRLIIRFGRSNLNENVRQFPGMNKLQFEVIFKSGIFSYANETIPA
jgi:hypothetical protein